MSKKFVYLKRFNEEYSGEECDFQTFKELMFDISDYYECEFEDHSNAVPEFPGGSANKYYTCEIKLPNFGSIDTDDLYFNCNYLRDLIGFPDEPGGVNFNNVKSTINSQNNRLIDLKSKIDSIVDMNKKVNEIFEILENQIVPRFEEFSNFESFSIGYDDTMGWGEIIKIYFDFPESE